jgi:hypothetical protein
LRGPAWPTALVLRPAYNAARPAEAYPGARVAAERAVALDTTVVGRFGKLLEQFGLGSAR